MESTYDPKAVEARWYSVWEDAGVFRPELHPDGRPFCIVIPPPNVTCRCRTPSSAAAG
jgi:valyl-tRNA synthetase